jgi:hypothetical protein
MLNIPHRDYTREAKYEPLSHDPLLFVSVSSCLEKMRFGGVWDTKHHVFSVGLISHLVTIYVILLLVQYNPELLEVSPPKWKGRDSESAKSDIVSLLKARVILIQ